MRTCCVVVLAGGVRLLLWTRRVRVRLVVAWLLLRVAAWLLTVMLLVWWVWMAPRSPALALLSLMLLAGLLLVLLAG